MFCPNMSDEEHNIYIIGSKLDHKLHALWSRVFGKQAFFSQCATRKMLKKIDKIQPDVVILRNLHGNYVNLPMLLKYLAKNDIATIGSNARLLVLHGTLHLLFLNQVRQMADRM